MGFQEYPDNRITQWIYIAAIIVSWENFNEKTLMFNLTYLMTHRDYGESRSKERNESVNETAGCTKVLKV